MRTLIVTEFISLDGVVEAPGGEPTHPNAGWTMAYRMPEGFAYKLQETLDAESMLLGRVTYQGFAAAWPSMEDVFADKMNSMPKDFITNTLTELEWNATAHSGDVANTVTEIKNGEGGPILVHGSATLVRTLLAERLVDELHLFVYPLLTGNGPRLYGEGERAQRIEGIRRRVS